MPTVHIDFPETGDIQSVDSEDTNGEDYNVTGYVIRVVIAEDEVEAWLDLYDPASGTSPSAANSRIIARAVLEALRVTVNP
jgi:hypothetical protein